MIIECPSLGALEAIWLHRRKGYISLPKGMFFYDNRTIWHRGQIDTANNLTSDNFTSLQFDTTCKNRQFDTIDNLTPGTIWHHGQFDTVDKLTQRTIWHRTILHQDNLTPLAKRDNFTSRTIWQRRQFYIADNLTPGQFDTTCKNRQIDNADNFTSRTI